VVNCTTKRAALILIVSPSTTLCAVAGLANASAAKVTVAFTLAILLRANQNDSGLRLRHACETFRLKFQTIDFIGAPDADS
jgi:hypothetical protein